MKHHFGPWKEDRTSSCTHCDVQVKVEEGQTTTKFLVNGQWTSKRPPCRQAWTSFGDVARGRIGQQCQYARHHLKEPEVVGSARWRGSFENYHSLEIHVDDVEAFVERVLDWRRRNGISRC